MSSFELGRSSCSSIDLLMVERVEVEFSAKRSKTQLALGLLRKVKRLL